MKLERLTIQGYQGIGYLDLNIQHPILLVAGKNGTGKTTIRDAIRFAITAESGRVAHKKDYPSLVRVGADPKKASVELVAGGFTYRRKVATGAGETPDYPLVLPHLLGNSRFALLTRPEQAALMFNVTNIDPRDPKRVRPLLEARHVAPECIDAVLPMLHGGFPDALKKCKDKQSECRGAWEAITEERFGTAKAENWTADPYKLAPVPLEQLQETLENLEGAVPALERGIAELEAEKTGMVQHTHSSGVTYTCPECAAELIIQQGKLVRDERKGEPEPPLEDMQALVRRINDARRELATVQQRIGTCSAQITQAKDAQRISDERTKRARQYLAEYNNWSAAAEALSPGGIPLQIIETGLKPINDRLGATCKATGWKPIVIHPDLTITYGGISYNLCSESEQWRADAALVEAFSCLSGARMFVLDRMDVLHPTERGALLKWLLGVAGDHDTIVILATLKEPPGNLPPAIRAVWLNEGGEVLEKAA